jgi:leucyl aminopeptidase (aminopeptidase T)
MLPAYPESLRRAFARNLLRNNLRLGRGENLLIETWSGTLPWAVSLDLEARLLGARPLLSLKDEPAYWRSLAEAPASQIGRIGDHEWAALSASDAYVELYGPEDALREERLPQAASRRAESNNHELMRVIQKHCIRSVRWDLGRTSLLWARRYGIGLQTWRSELIDAAMVDPRDLQRDGAWVASRLEKGHEVTITHPNGTHLVLRLARRPPKIDDGIIDEKDVKSGNVFMIVPTGVVSVTVNELYAEGCMVSNATGVLYADDRETPLSPGRWTFRHGALESFHCQGGGRQLRQALAHAGNPRVRAGQLSVGLNPRISTIPLLFDQSRGTITFEMGRNAPMGGRSRTPHLLAFLDLTGGSLQIDGEPLVERGKLVAPS